MSDKIKLNVLGISYSQTQTGAYALILEEEEGERRLPIIIGSMEAQAIAIQLEGLQPSRPLTHDLMTTVLSSFNIAVLEVNITKLEEGIFYSELTCEHNSTRVVIDARTSDAVALALRFNCSVYASSTIMEKAGISMDTYGDEMEVAGDSTEQEEETESLTDMTTEELEATLQKAITEEDYEYASQVRDEIQRRENKDT